MAIATFNGVPLFGPTCHAQPTPARIAEQRDTYPGLNGYTSVIQGTRGGAIRINGYIIADTFADIPGSEAALLATAGSGTGVLVDTVGRIYPNAYFLGEYVPDPAGPKWTDFGVVLPFTCTFYYFP